ncbi:MAG: sulfatase-like hydrolase/transferase, partial [Planctomycetales bacterium]
MLRGFIACCVAVIGFLVARPATAADSKRPNVVWIFVEDMNGWYGCYGDDTVPTPHLDALANRGLRFDRAYMPAGVCSATRSAIALGAMQTSLGVHNHRSSRKRVPEEINLLPQGVKTVYEMMRASGYFVTTQGANKNDFNFIWDSKKLYDVDRSSRSVGEPLWRNRPQDKPFFAQIQLRGGKNSGRYQGAAASKPSASPAKNAPKKKKGAKKKAPPGPFTDPSQMKVAPYYPDHPVMRREYAHHYDTIRQTDDEVGQIVAALKKDGLLENTVVFFWTDHGLRLPRHKQWLYEGGVRVPLVIAGPGVAKGKSRDDLVNGIDITAATLALAGAKRGT